MKLTGWKLLYIRNFHRRLSSPISEEKVKNDKSQDTVVKTVKMKLTQVRGQLEISKNKTADSWGL